jgi:hypothetical protein
VVWVLVCALVVLFGGGYLFLVGREVARKGVRLVREVDEAVHRAEAAYRRPAPEDLSGT